MGQQRPSSQDPFIDDASEQLPSQFYLVDAATGEYRQYSAMPGYSPSDHGATAHVGMQAAILPEPVPAMMPVPVALAVGAGATSTAGARGHHLHHQRQEHQHNRQDHHHHNAYIDLPNINPPVAPPPATLLAAAHPQLDYHHRHLPVQPHPRTHHPPSLHSHPVHRFPGRPLTMATTDEHGMAAQQEAARAYQPNLDGPSIGDKTPIEAIVEEPYLKPTAHTAASRAMATADGEACIGPLHGTSCSLLTITTLSTAIGFCYFEKLVEAGDADQVEGEAARLMSMNHFLGTVGGYDYYEDWADEAIGLLRTLAGCVTDPAAAHALVHDRWTDPATSSALIYYLRLLAATHLKAHADQYDPFVPDGQGIRAYCSQSVELPDREIEQLGIIALYNCLLKPLDLVLEIAYLDRSPGAQVNTYRFPEEAITKDPAVLGPMIQLLYRPDHYDILYRRPTVVVADIMVNRATDVYSHTPINSTHSSLGAFSTADFGLLASLPSASPSGMSTLTSPNIMHTPAPPSSSCGSFVPDGQWMSPLPTHAASSNAPIVQRGRSHPAADTLLTSPGPKAPPPPATATATAPEAECNIRFTKMQYNYEEDSSRAALLGLLPFNVTTTTFKNSVWNRAHFGNPEFRPEQWRPGDDGADDRTRKKKGSGGNGSAKET
ncbi:ubiquitin thiolesterase [Cordyceps militaris]|uniref:Ubiquitin thiolesterase n=1 Tax=Cordyceps militaris TaxID=73501 RepID=A0A2H4S871_CORMI|nr:ubiquitin thiolesterase [Cordyceps militaris]